MEITALLINALKGITGIIFPPFKKKYFDQPKIYIRLSGNSGTFRGVDKNVDLYQNPGNILDPLQTVYCEWRKDLTFYNNSEHVAYNLNLASHLDSSHFKITPAIDNFTPLKVNENRTYTLTVTDTYERKTSQARLQHEETDLLKNIKIVLKYTNVKGTKFYTSFDNSADINKQNEFARRKNGS